MPLIYKDHRRKAITANLEYLDRRLVSVGLQGDKGRKLRTATFSNAAVGAVHHFGLAGFRRRPWMVDGEKRLRATTKSLMARCYSAAIRGGQSQIDSALGALAAHLVLATRAGVDMYDVIDTGEMRASITAVVGDRA
ncbi:MAG: hypothetical protein B7733_05910 [Myxococcales bacterium FL481]|nr:MAG: hypothetical protein B7733_05910 [Myxococcales bacterium FL481]